MQSMVTYTYKAASKVKHVTCIQQSSGKAYKQEHIHIHG